MRSRFRYLDSTIHHTREVKEHTEEEDHDHVKERADLASKADGRLRELCSQLSKYSNEFSVVRTRTVSGRL